MTYRGARRGLYAVAGVLLARLSEQANRKPQIVQGIDGKTYEIPTMDAPAGMLAICARALLVALDLEAHALGIDMLLLKVDWSD
jgi:hypothetical protein